MKNIFIFDENISSKVNGIGSFLRELVSVLEELKCNINLLSYNADVKEFSIEDRDGIKLWSFPPFYEGDFINQPAIAIRMLQKYVKDSSENYFLTNHSPCSKLLKTIKEKFPLSKVIFTIHDMGWTSMLLGDCEELKRIIANRDSEDIKTQYSHVLSYFDSEKEMFEIADHVICLSDFTCDILCDIYNIDRKKIKVIPNGLRMTAYNTTPDEKEQIRKDFYIDPDEKVILYVGRLCAAKGIYSLIKAFESVLKRYSKARLVVGGSNEDEWKKLFSMTNRFSSRITLTGFIPSDQVEKWYKISDVGVIPSYSEQCSYTGMEMMMHRLPVVSSDGAALKEMFKDGSNAVVAQIGDRNDEKSYIDNLSSAIISLLDSPRMREELKQQAFEIYSSNYNIEKMKNLYRDFIVSI